MNGEFGFRLVIRFNSETVPAIVLSKVVAAVEDVGFKAEVAELRDLRHVDEDLPPVAFDAATYRMNELRGSAVTISGAREGSVILVGIVGGLAYWVLDKTLGETLTEAWKATETRGRLVGFLAKRRGRKAQDIAASIEKKATVRKGNWPTLVHAETKDGAIEVEVTVLRDEMPPAA